ncbi:MAG: DPP IV N-terminal domain-containing protein [Polaribacter sp.]|jgi:dienelactone hydrolase|nr:DPP IV N-terminal domain-containing protein [Polaribacter sp.]MDG2072994.1 DPP IV N-terminal domain-containing protein [Polaribacter sp.]
MKKLLQKVSIVSLSMLLLIGCSTSNEQKQRTADDYKNAAKFMQRSWSGKVHNQIGSQNWTGDDELIYSKSTANGTEYVSVNTKTKEKSNLSDYKAPKREARKAKRNEHVSPNGKLAAYIDNYNLWVRDLSTNRKTQITFDGKEDYGYATNNAGWTKGDNAVLKWSPNSDKIATFQQDARGVGMMYLTTTNVGHQKLEAWKHPLPGDKTIFTIERVIIHLGARPKMVRLKMEKDFQRGSTTDHIAGRGGVLLDAQWSKDGSKFAFVSGSRDHKEAHLQIADSRTGRVSSIHKEVVDTYYESGVRAENWRVLFDSNEFIWYSEKSNWGHIYLYDLNTSQLKNQITSGDWLLKQIKHVDQKSREIFFSAGGKEEGNPYHDYIYKVNFDGTNLTNLTPDKGHHSVSFSPNMGYFVDTYSTIDTPPISVLRDRNGAKIADLETADISELKSKGWKAPIEFNVKARDNKTDLYGVLFTPTNYDESKKYPVLNYIYPGPQSGSVGNYGFRAVWRDFQAVAELGFIVVAVDAQGTPGRSKSFHDFYYGNMGDNGIPDNIAAIKQLAKEYKGMDLENVGIWGHSGGGFASTRAVFAYPDFYDVAVSGAGNHDNRNYEADWGEKWQGLLVEGNMEGKGDGTTNYDNQANQLLAGELKGKLLITHGSIDNNVPPSNTMLVVEALIKENKDFDMILFPNQRHGYGNMTNYMTRKRWDYFITHLRNEIPPKEFDLVNFK